MLDTAASSKQSQELSELLERFVEPLLQWLDEQIDKRLVRNFVLCLLAIVKLRHRGYGLLLSELGAYVLSPDKAPVLRS